MLKIETESTNYVCGTTNQQKQLSFGFFFHVWREMRTKRETEAQASKQLSSLGRNRIVRVRVDLIGISRLKYLH